MNAFWWLFLEKWVPPLLSVALGSFIASWLVPRWQHRYKESVLLDQRRLDYVETISELFTEYISHWRRLIQITEHQLKQGSLTNIELSRKNSFVEGRNKKRDALISKLSTASFYFSEDVSQEINSFIDWDKEQTVKSLAELPSIDDWERKRRIILNFMQKETIHS